jgi:hypothetical protein
MGFSGIVRAGAWPTRYSRGPHGPEVPRRVLRFHCLSIVFRVRLCRPRDFDTKALAPAHFRSLGPPVFP